MKQAWSLGEHAFANTELVARGACVWAHQAGEKAIKALLTGHDIDPPKRHDLDRLVRLLPPDDVDQLVVLDLAGLSRWAIEGRYPDDFDEATRVQTMEALIVAKRMVVLVERRLTELFGDDA